MNTLEVANDELMAEFRRIWPTVASPFTFPAWYANLARLHATHAGPAAWGRLTKAERHARILAGLRELAPFPPPARS